MTTLSTYIAARVVEDGGCLRWIGTIYGGHPGGRIAGIQFLVRRALYEQKHGPIPIGHLIRCNCGMKLCIKHFELVTRKQLALECGALGLMGGPIRGAKIAAIKRSSPKAKIDQSVAREIRDSDEPLRVFAERHGITISTASKIRRGELRKEYAGNPWASMMPNHARYANP